jgi:hypothetical protein
LITFQGSCLRKRVLLSLTLFGSEEICFTPGFPVKGPKLGSLSSYTHMVAPTFEISLLSSLSSELVDFHCNFVLGTQFFFLSQNRHCHSHLSLNISSGTLDKLLDNNSGRITFSLRIFFPWR